MASGYRISSNSNSYKVRIIRIPRDFIIKHWRLKQDLKLFLLLKLMYPEGKYKTCELPIDLVAKELDIHKRTIVRRLKKLEKIQWVSHNNQTGYTLIYSPERLVWGKKKTRCSRQKLMLHNIREIDSVVGYVLFRKCASDFKLINKEQGGSAQLTSHAFTSHLASLPKGYYPVALRGVSKRFSTPLSTINTLKKAALRAGYLRVIPTNRIIKPGSSAMVESHYPFKLLKGGTVYQKGVDLFSFELIY